MFNYEFLIFAWYAINWFIGIVGFDVLVFMCFYYCLHKRELGFIIFISIYGYEILDLCGYTPLIIPPLGSIWK